MLNKVATRIQSRLSRKGLKIVLGEIKEQCIKTFQNLENPTKVEINAVTDYFMNNATKLTVITEDIEAAITNEAAPEQETLTNNNSDKLEPETTLETSICVDDENGNIQPTTTEEKETLETLDSVNSICVDDENGNISPTLTGEPETLGTVDEVNTLTTGNNSHPVASDHENLPQSQHQIDRTGWYQPAPLATTEKSELVSSTAANLGIALSTEDIEHIAENINTSSDDLTDSLEEIQGAIIGYIEYKAALNSQKIATTLNEITQVVTDKFNQNSQQLTNGLRQINQNLEQQTKDFKSNIKKGLAAFTIPSIKAG